MLRKLIAAGAVVVGLTAGALSFSAPAANAIPINGVAMTSSQQPQAGHAPSGEDISYVVTHMGTEVLSKNVCTKPSDVGRSKNRIHVPEKVYTPAAKGDAAPVSLR